MFRWYLSRAIRRGTLILIESTGRVTTFGEKKDGPALTIRVHDKPTMRRISLHPDLALGEAFMDGTLTVENGSIRDVIGLIFEIWPTARRCRRTRC